MVHLQELYEQLKDKGLVILGLNHMDEKKIALDLMHEYGVTFPNALDDSDAALEVFRKDYRGGSMPTNCIVDRDGTVVDSWPGYRDYREQDPRPMDALIKTGGELEKAVRKMRDAQFAQSVKEVTTEAERLFQAIRDANYDYDSVRTSSGDSEGFLGADVIYFMKRSQPRWERWVCEKFKANPITEVRLGEIFLNTDRLLTIHFELQLKDGEVLQGDLPFKWSSTEKQWIGRHGLDWHLREAK